MTLGDQSDVATHGEDDVVFVICQRQPDRRVSQMCINTNVLEPSTKSRTDTLSEPLIPHVHRIPYTPRKIRRPLIHINELNELRIQMRIAERPVRHERVVEMLRMRGVALQGMELRELRLHRVSAFFCGLRSRDTGEHAPQSQDHTPPAAQAGSPNRPTRV